MSGGEAEWPGRYTDHDVPECFRASISTHESPDGWRGGPRQPYVPRFLMEDEKIVGMVWHVEPSLPVPDGDSKWVARALASGGLAKVDGPGPWGRFDSQLAAMTAVYAFLANAMDPEQWQVGDVVTWNDGPQMVVSDEVNAFDWPVCRWWKGAELMSAAFHPAELEPVESSLQPEGGAS